METEPSDQYLFQKLKFGNDSQKVRKSRYQSFVICPILLDFFYFALKQSK